MCFILTNNSFFLSIHNYQRCDSYGQLLITHSNKHTSENIYLSKLLVFKKSWPMSTNQYAGVFNIYHVLNTLLIWHGIAQGNIASIFFFFQNERTYIHIKQKIVNYSIISSTKSDIGCKCCASGCGRRKTESMKIMRKFDIYWVISTC